MTCSRCGRETTNGGPACPACVSQAAAVTIGQAGVTGGEGAPATPAAPVPVAAPAPAPPPLPLPARAPAPARSVPVPPPLAPGSPAAAGPGTAARPPAPEPAAPESAAPESAAPESLPAAPSVSKYDLRAPAPGTGGRRIMLISAALVLVLAAAGGVVALVTASGPGAAARGQLLTQPGGQSGTAPGGGAAAGRGTAPAGRQGRTVRPAVILAPAVRSQPYARPAGRFLARYFRAINHHDYRAYLRLFAPASRAALSQSRFLAGYGTTHDVTPRLIRLTQAGLRQLAATVTFTSHQDATASPAHASCLHWRITVYLIRHGTRHERYFIGTPPAGYAAREHAC